MDIVDSFFKQFEILADAPNAVPKLRELILQLAMRGRLVPQDPNDEPASILLEKIKSEKQKFIEQNRFAKEKELPKVEDTEIPNDIPKRWLYRRLGELFIISSGTTPSRVKSEYFYQGTENWIKTTDLNNSIVTTCEEKITIQAVKECNLKYYPVKTVCIAMYGGAGTIGKSGILGFATTINQSVCGIYPNPYYCPEFLHIYVKSIRSEWMSFAAGLRKDPNINGKIINNMIVPLPPLNEQKRIVEKVDKLMEWCDRLEKQQQQRRETCINLNRVALTQLTTAKTTDEFSDRWQKVRDNFDLLYNLPENVSQLRQTILQLAVMGKLVKQDPNDETASILLERIQYERESENHQKIKEKVNFYENTPYSVPTNWCWSSVENLCTHIVDCLHSTPQFVDSSSFLCIDTTCIKQGEIIFEKVREVSESTFIDRIRRLKPEAGDILFSREGTLGIAVTLPSNIKACLGQRMMMFRTSKWVFSEYFRYALISDMFVQQWQSKTTGTAAQHINIGDIRKMVLPLPPLNEQKRIVAKVEEMMRLCDGLEAKLKEAETNRQNLLETGIRQVLSQI